MRAIQEYYGEDFSHCYGCGTLNKQGHQLKTYSEDDLTISRYLPKDYHIAIDGYVYGGLLASLIDCHGTGSAAIFYAKNNNIELKKNNSPRFVTANLNVNFLKPTPLGKELLIQGRLKEITARKVITSIEVMAEDIVCVKGEVTAVLLPENFGR